jgi:predicted MPP superfamily phosphohydrolase
MIKRLRQYWKNRTTRRRFLLGTAGGGMAAMGAGYAYMRLWESGWLEVNRREVKLDKPHALETPIKILHLSDLHASKVVSLAYLRRALKMGLDLQPDLICVTGDFITWKYKRYAEYAEVLSQLSAAAPTFACLGNHDGGTTSVNRKPPSMESTPPTPPFCFRITRTPKMNSPHSHGN